MASHVALPSSAIDEYFRYGPSEASAADDLKDFAAFVKDFKEETDRGAALIGAALVDSELEKLLRSHFIDGESTDRLWSTLDL